MSWRDRVTGWSENVFPGIGHKVQEIEGEEILSNLPLQISVYFNAVFCPVWMMILILFLNENYKEFNSVKQFLITTLTISIFLVEILRIFMAYEGNLNEKIPELAGFWMLSLFIQLPLQTAFLATPYFHLYVLEITCQSIMIVFLITQIIFGYFALKRTAKRQAIYFKIMKLKNSATIRQNIDKNK